MVKITRSGPVWVNYSSRSAYYWDEEKNGIVDAIKGEKHEIYRRISDDVAIIHDGNGIKLNSKTKNSVESGDLLLFENGDIYHINRVMKNGNSVTLTITDTKDGRTIYGYPSSKLYGAEIIVK